LDGHASPADLNFPFADHASESVLIHDLGIARPESDTMPEKARLMSLQANRIIYLSKSIVVTVAYAI
jgi:hypothetical protein